MAGNVAKTELREKRTQSAANVPAGNVAFLRLWMNVRPRKMKFAKTLSVQNGKKLLQEIVFGSGIRAAHASNAFLLRLRKAAIY